VEYSTSIGGLLLGVRKTPSGWEVSISGPASLLNEATAKNMAEKWASKILSKDSPKITWKKVG
jgi:hypothetical protein